jgi:hypothetical protein
MRRVPYKDERGRWYIVELPDEVPDSQASMGIPVGPPDVVDHLNLPEPFATTLHNQLFERGLLTAQDVRHKTGSLQGAIAAAMMVDVARIHEAYVYLETAQEN